MYKLAWIGFFGLMTVSTGFDFFTSIEKVKNNSQGNKYTISPVQAKQINEFYKSQRWSESHRITSLAVKTCLEQKVGGRLPLGYLALIADPLHATLHAKSKLKEGQELKKMPFSMDKYTEDAMAFEASLKNETRQARARVALAIENTGKGRKEWFPKCFFEKVVRHAEDNVAGS